MFQRFTDQIVIITGGGSGIGEAITRRVSAEGGRVVIFDTNEASMARVAADCHADTLSVDISDEQGVRDAVDQVIRRYDRLDVVVNCAGIVGPTSTSTADYPTADFEQVMRVNLFGSFYITRCAIPPMLARGYGRILLMASIGGKEGNPGMVGYAASKSGVIGLVKAAGKEYATSGITINGMAPAVIRTPMNADTSPELLQYMTERIPMKRLGTVEEAAALACWIVSPEASFNTGFIFDLSGGRATY
jgi:NAD(P)-dependent dehydrogenase (short-subunit alcohol dehydrogenase family)